MRYKQHLGESCNVTTTFKKVLCVRMYVRVSCSPSKTFDSKIPICSCSYMSELREKYHICDISSTWERVVICNNIVQESSVCTYVRSGVVLTTQDVLFKDTYMFLLLHVRATQKVSYMRYKQHLGESCNVTTTFKKVLCVRMYAI